MNVSGLASGVASVAAGISHSCARTTGGSVMCWGDNTYGQLGDGTLVARATPVAVPGLSGVVDIVAGQYHTCAHLGSGAAVCWGRNNVGQLGDASGSTQTSPVAVIGLSSGVTAITTKLDHTCVLRTTGGIRCWGANAYGHIGNNSTADQSTPQDVSGLTSGIASVSAGSYHTCAVTTAGVAKCWGNNGNTQLGDSTGTNRLVPTDVATWLTIDNEIFRNGFEVAN